MAKTPEEIMQDQIDLVEQTLDAINDALKSMTPTPRSTTDLDKATVEIDAQQRKRLDRLMKDQQRAASEPDRRERSAPK